MLNLVLPFQRLCCATIEASLWGIFYTVIQRNVLYMLILIYRSFSSDVTAAILVYQNNEMAAILVYGTGISSFVFKYFVLFHHPTGATDHVSENDLLLNVTYAPINVNGEGGVGHMWVIWSSIASPPWGFWLAFWPRVGAIWTKWLLLN
jgi:hypothetical protein